MSCKYLIGYYGKLFHCMYKVLYLFDYKSIIILMRFSLFPTGKFYLSVIFIKNKLCNQFSTLITQIIINLIKYHLKKSIIKLSSIDMHYNQILSWHTFYMKFINCIEYNWIFIYINNNIIYLFIYLLHWV